MFGRAQIADVVGALPIALVGGALLARAATGEGKGARIATAAAFALLLALIVAAQLGHGLWGYHSDLWMYLTFAGRIGEGEWLLDRDVFWLLPPSQRMHALPWWALGLAERFLGVSPVAGVPWLAAASVALLFAGAWRLSGIACSDPRTRALALICFGAGLHQEWAALALNRNLALAFVLLATARALDFPGGGRAACALAAWIAVAFYTHLFAGFLALGGAALASLARVRAGEPLHAPALAAGATLGVVLAAPWLWLARPPDAELSAAHLAGPGTGTQLFGFRVFRPGALFHFASPALLLAAAAALLVRDRLGLSPPARALAWIAPLAVAALLFTPLYHVATALFGGWMPPRSAVLAFLWLPAGAALAALGSARASDFARPLLVLLGVALFGIGGARVVRDLRAEALYAPYRAQARAEATELRGLLHLEKYASAATLAYGLAPFARGRPAVVPPGHASPYHPFGAHWRVLRRALDGSQPDCWARIGALHPDLRFLVTPSPGATSENALWRSEVPGRTPEALRADLQSRGAARLVHAGETFTVHELSPAAFEGDPERCASAEGIERSTQGQP